MKYKFLALATVLLLSTPLAVFGQQMSPIVVKTGKPTPSVVRSGELFQVTYRAEFNDKVLILQDQMSFDSLDLVVEKDQMELVLEKMGLVEKRENSTVEVAGLSVGEKLRIGSEDEGFVNIQDFTYTFRIIRPHKGKFKIASFNFVWGEKRSGVTEEETSEKVEPKEMPTEEVSINYVSSIVGRREIRDESKLSSYKWKGDQIRKFAYSLIGVYVLLSLFAGHKFLKFPKLSKPQEKVKSDSSSDQASGEAVNYIQPKLARKTLLRELRKILKDPAIDQPSLDLEKKVYDLVRQYLLVELAGEPINALPSSSPKEIYERLNDLDEKDALRMDLSRYKAMLYLAVRSKFYYQDLETGSINYFTEPRAEIEELIQNTSSLSWRKKLGKFLRQLLGISHA